MSNDNDRIEKMGIIGAGFMGTQIALQCAHHRFDVTIVDKSKESIQRSKDILEEQLEKWGEVNEEVKNKKLKTKDRIHYTTETEEGVKDADLVVESVPEKLDLKKDVFSQLDSICSEETILATNSSSIKISKIEEAVDRKDKVLNTHFYPPVWDRPMVELMRGTETSKETVVRVCEFFRDASLTTLMVKKESTGFLFNRVWRAIKRETLHLVDDGVASHEDVDRAWMIFTGMDVGPFGLMDTIGLDVVKDIEMIYYDESGEERDHPPDLLLDKLEKGDLGVKSGKGFYEYPHPAYEDEEWLMGEEDCEDIL
ncbi:MAG: 3-hydroxyacyl-CoA dehydrogenase family protein [Candidatus Thermoplasmatota archaeon]